jgi:hypothetical protein
MVSTRSLTEMSTRNVQNKLRGLSPQANYTDRATAACRRSYYQLLRIEGVTWSAQRIPTAVFSVFYPGCKWRAARKGDNLAAIFEPIV